MCSFSHCFDRVHVLFLLTIDACMALHACLCMTCGSRQAYHALDGSNGPIRQSIGMCSLAIALTGCFSPFRKKRLGPKCPIRQKKLNFFGTLQFGKQQNPTGSKRLEVFDTSIFFETKVLLEYFKQKRCSQTGP